MADEKYFWAVVLNSEIKEFEWNPEKDFTKDDDTHSLKIKRAVLDHAAVDGEIAAIEVETKGYDEANVKTLISVLVKTKLKGEDPFKAQLPHLLVHSVR